MNTTAVETGGFVDLTEKNINPYQESPAPLKITFQIGAELHPAKNDLQQEPKQRAQKILVYGLPGRCKHFNCRLFQHLASRSLTTLSNSYLHKAYLIYSDHTS